MNSRRLQYAQWTTNDFDELWDILGNPKVCEFLPGNNQRTKEEVQKCLDHYITTFGNEQGNRIYKISTFDGDVIGYGGLAYVKEFDAMEILYGFKESVWGHGYASEASMRFKELAMELGFQKLIALADINNHASNKILQKTGYTMRETISLWGLVLHLYDLKL